MPPVATLSPTRARALALEERRERLGVPKAEIARRTGRVTPSEHAYLGSVLRGETTSAPVCDEVERVLDEVEAKTEAAA